MMDGDAQAEWEAWQRVVRLLRETGAVTDKDLQSSVRLNDTTGQKLLNAIRQWGERRKELGG